MAGEAMHHSPDRWEETQCCAPPAEVPCMFPCMYACIYLLIYIYVYIGYIYVFILYYYIILLYRHVQWGGDLGELLPPRPDPG